MFTPTPLRIAPAMQYTLKATGKTVFGGLSMSHQESNTSSNDKLGYYLPPLRFVPRPTPLRKVVTAREEEDDDDDDDSVSFTPTKFRCSFEGLQGSLLDCTLPSPPRVARARLLGSPSTPVKAEKKCRGMERQTTMESLSGTLFPQASGLSSTAPSRSATFDNSPAIDRLLSGFDTSSLFDEALPRTPERSAPRDFASPSFSPGADVLSFTPTRVPSVCPYPQLMDESPLCASGKFANFAGLMELSFSPLCRAAKRQVAPSTPPAVALTSSASHNRMPPVSPEMKFSLAFSLLKDQRVLSPPRRYGPGQSRCFMNLSFSPLSDSKKSVQAVDQGVAGTVSAVRESNSVSSNLEVASESSSRSCLASIRDTYKRCASLFEELFPGEIDKDENMPKISSGSPCRVVQAVPPPGPPEPVVNSGRMSIPRCGSGRSAVGTSSALSLSPAPRPVPPSSALLTAASKPRWRTSELDARIAEVTAIFFRPRAPAKRAATLDLGGA
ncbi:hypothetical protein BOTBODRAFT_192952 [Botryobasidium botryosum FD-172 SS1]|uniref:Uncharacterized protein n=1 Tax=Botryobasidium botryosum (strain FD-172 SS1) TaxID=930990 RepID=A0A067M4Y9_BOTB1|nr:hypothetical protein BOTBODRAFT_192952 [Botryobasidium botryosum FD-172 SS1]